MARKRLTGPLPDYLDPDASSGPAPRSPMAPARAPIAQITGEAATQAAFDAVAAELQAARDEGRMVLSLPLAAIAVDYLIRDRIEADPAAMTELIGSLRARGQQAPVEVAEIGQVGGVPRYGLISGWRRYLALRTLARETGDARFGNIRALVRRPETGAEAYVAMVEENEIRANLSFYERARIVMRAVEAGVYPTQRHALQGLFSTASFAKRSKVKSFIPVVLALDGLLHFPARIPERLGLALSKALEAPGFVARATIALTPPATTPEAEAAILAQLLRPVRSDTEADRTEADIPDLTVTLIEGQIVISGADVTPLLARRLRRWLGLPGE